MPDPPFLTVVPMVVPHHRPSVFSRLKGKPGVVFGGALTALTLGVAAEAGRLAPGDPFHVSAPDRLRPPSAAHLMGTDQLGRDIYTGVVRGAHTSLSIVVGVVAISSVVGVIAGLAAGYRGRLLDDIVMRVIDVVQSIPRFFLAILVAGWFGHASSTLTVMLGLTSWPFIARVVRAETLSLRERDFVVAARSMGASHFRVVFGHLLPNTATTALTVIALTGSRVVLIEAGLSFLGLGDPNLPSWGSLINNAQPYLQRAWWMSVFPGAAIACTILGMNLLADGLGGAFNQRQWRPRTLGRLSSARG